MVLGVEGLRSPVVEADDHPAEADMGCVKGHRRPVVVEEDSQLVVVVDMGYEMARRSLALAVGRVAEVVRIVVEADVHIAEGVAVGRNVVEVEEVVHIRVDLEVAHHDQAAVEGDSLGRSLAEEVALVEGSLAEDIDSEVVVRTHPLQEHEHMAGSFHEMMLTRLLAIWRLLTTLIVGVC